MYVTPRPFSAHAAKFEALTHMLLQARRRLQHAGTHCMQVQHPILSLALREDVAAAVHVGSATAVPSAATWVQDHLATAGTMVDSSPVAGRCFRHCQGTYSSAGGSCSISSGTSDDNSRFSTDGQQAEATLTVCSLQRSDSWWTVFNTLLHSRTTCHALAHAFNDDVGHCAAALCICIPVSESIADAQR
jgi:hypothetical protein